MTNPRPLDDKADSSASDQPGAAKRRSWLVRLAVSAVVLGWLIWRTHWAPLVATLVELRFEFFLAALGLYCIAQVISSYRWMLLARGLGFDQGLGRFVALYYVGMFFNLFLPTSMGGDVVRAWHLTPEPGRRWAAALSVFSERFSGLLALLAMGCAATLLRPDAVPVEALWAIWAATAAGFLGLVTLPWVSRWYSKLRQLSASLSLCAGQRRRWIVSLLLSLMVQVASVIEIWLLGLALDFSVPFLAYMIVVPLVTLVTLLPISLNGVGVREASLVLLLGQAGVAPAGALVLGLVWFAMLLAAGLLGGGVYAFGRLFRRKEMDAHGSVRGDSDQGRRGKPAAAA